MYEKIKKLLNERGISPYQASKLTGITQASFSDWKVGKSQPSVDKLKTLAEYFKIPVGYFYGEKMTQQKSEHPNAEFVKMPTDVVKIPVLGKISAGIPLEANEDILGYEEIPAEWTKNGQRFFALKIQGDSMYPNYIEGDTVILRAQSACESGKDVAVIINNDTATIKRIQCKTSGIILQPLNPKYNVMMYTNEEIESLPISIIGVVVELRRKI